MRIHEKREEIQIFRKPVFLTWPNPEPGDTRPRNAFGVLKSFGQQYKEYYDKKDSEAAKKGK